MKSVFIIGLLLMMFILINDANSQGSPAASIGAYITLYKERKRIKALREQQKRDKNKKPKAPIIDSRPYADCDYYWPCRYY